jgi:hypothetical protein
MTRVIHKQNTSYRKGKQSHMNNTFWLVFLLTCNGHHQTINVGCCFIFLCMLLQPSSDYLHTFLYLNLGVLFSRCNYSKHINQYLYNCVNWEWYCYHHSWNKLSNRPATFLSLCVHWMKMIRSQKPWPLIGVMRYYYIRFWLSIIQSTPIIPICFGTM